MRELTGRLEPLSDRICDIDGYPFVQHLVSDVVVAQVFGLTAQTLVDLKSLQATLDSDIFDTQPEHGLRQQNVVRDTRPHFLCIKI